MNTSYTLFIILFLAAAFGWVANIVKFAKLDFEAPYKSEVIRGISIPAWPVGSVIGFIKIGEEK